MTTDHNEYAPGTFQNSSSWEPVGGDDPDFAPVTEFPPLLCKVPWLKSVLPACR